MTVLLITPEYLSHYLPFAVLGREARRRGHRVVVATGPALRRRVVADGLEHVELRLGAGRNDGVAVAGLDDAFFAATRKGMAATVRYQVAEREHDMFWQPREVARQVERLLDDIAPEVVVVDQLAYGATIALRALERPFTGLLPSHPCQLPRPGDPDGFPVRYPLELAPGERELAGLRKYCAVRSARLTAASNHVLVELNPGARPLDDLVSTPGSAGTLVAYPPALDRASVRNGVELIGPLVRPEEPDAELIDALRRRRRDARRSVYVSLGTFLSAREDVLRSIADALRALDLEAIVSTGRADPACLGPVPRSWHVRATLPQVAALAACDAVVCHGGNNTVMEALAKGLPVLAGPMSSDQFVAAEDLRRAGVGDAFDPNRADGAAIARRLHALIDGSACARAAELARDLRARPGAVQACDLLRL